MNTGIHRRGAENAEEASQRKKRKEKNFQYPFSAALCVLCASALKVSEF